MGVGAGLYMYVVVVHKFTFAISSPDEFLLFLVTRSALTGACVRACVRACVGVFINAGPTMCDVYHVLMKCAKTWIERVDWHSFTIHLTSTELARTCAMYDHCVLSEHSMCIMQTGVLSFTVAPDVQCTRKHGVVAITLWTYSLKRSELLVHVQVTIIFVVSVGLSVCLSVCLFVCLCRVFLSRLWSDFNQIRTYVICLGLVVSPRI